MSASDKISLSLIWDRPGIAIATSISHHIEVLQEIDFKKSAETDSDSKFSLSVLEYAMAEHGFLRAKVANSKRGGSVL